MFLFDLHWIGGLRNGNWKTWEGIGSVRLLGVERVLLFRTLGLPFSLLFEPGWLGFAFDLVCVVWFVFVVFGCDWSLDDCMGIDSISGLFLEIVKGDGQGSARGGLRVCKGICVGSRCHQ